MAVALDGELQRHLVEIGPADQSGYHSALGRFLGEHLAIHIELVETETDVGAEMPDRTVAADHVELETALRTIGRQHGRAAKLPVRIDDPERCTDMQIVDRKCAQIDTHGQTDTATGRSRLGL